MNAFDRSVLDSVQIVDTKEVGRDSYEICATAEARLEESAHVLKVVLDSFVRRFEMRGKDEMFRPAWLPRRDLVETHVSLEEAPDAAKEIFSSWTQKVRRVIPPTSEWRTDAGWIPSVPRIERREPTR